MSGKTTSRMRQYGWNLATLARPSCPLSAISIWYPACSRVAAIKRQVVGLSSTTRTLGWLITVSPFLRTLDVIPTFCILRQGFRNTRRGLLIDHLLICNLYRPGLHFNYALMHLWHAATKPVDALRTS